MRAVGKRQRNHEIVHAVDFSFDLFTGRQCDDGCHGRRRPGWTGATEAAPTAWQDPCLLECFRIGIPGRHAFQIARNGMAGSALCIKERFAGLCIAHDNIDISGPGAAADREAVNVGGNVGNLIGGEREFRHSPVAAVQQNGTDRLAFLIIQYKLGSEQVGSVVTAASIGSVAEAAVDVEQYFPARHRSRVGDRPLGIRDEASASPRTAGCRRILGGGRNRENASQNADEDVSNAHSLPQPIAGPLWAAQYPGKDVCRRAG